MIISSFNSQDGSWGIMNYQEIFTNRYYLNAIGHSFTLSLSASLFSEVIAILGAWALTKMSSTVKESLVTIFNLASSFAGVPLAFSLIILLGNSGVVHVISKSMNVNFLSSINIYSWFGLVIAYSFFEIPMGILFLYPTFEEIDHGWKEASETLGANNWFFLKKVIYPVLIPGLVETLIILFANSMGTYETVFALTGNNITLISTIIGTLIGGELSSNIPLACALSVIFGLMMVALVILGNLLVKKRQLESK
ncbi:ABC transporter permease [Companilactobacillus farciminis KCTC 3681 = DSM 20184]|nr:ABC transporter permease subunit [Companilactobacillus farciminis]KRK62725.1 ABC transporter permease [Companilactobacillus farciminis KCTC 3681 = DSM 20184]